MKMLCRAIIVTLITLLSGGSLWAAKPAAQTDRQAPKVHDASLAVSTAAAMTGLKNKTLTLIDVRPAAEFAEFHIPGSLNIPLHAVKTKTYLKAKPVVLANEGYGVEALETACRRLQADGFDAGILDGGILAWKSKGGAVLGDPFALAAINQVPAWEFHREKDYAGQILIHATAAEEKSTLPLPSNTVSLPLLESGQAVRQLKTMIRKAGSAAFATLLVFTDTGKENPRLQRLLAAEGIHQVFFLEGGLQGYEKQLQYNLLARQPRAKRTVRSDGCRSCPRE